MMIKKYRPQLRLIDSIKSFIVKDLRLYLPSDFYENWAYVNGDSMYTILYVSSSNRVEWDQAYLASQKADLAADTVINEQQNSMPKSIESQLIAKSKELTAQGYQTLVYKTAGVSFTRLSPKLLSYPPEAITQIIIHEVVHKNLYKLDRPINHSYEEALCDVVSFMATVRFAKKTGMVDIHAAEKQRGVVERTYSFLNKERPIIDTMDQQGKPALFKTCTTAIRHLTAHANQFVKDRMIYDVNNAYFLRMADYTLNYFKIKRMLGSKFDFLDVISQIKKLQGK